MSERAPVGVITYIDSPRKTDYLYRISIKGLIRNEKGEVLVVKEAGRNYWDLPGGGMDHGEDFKTAISREMKEEVNLEGDFRYDVIAVDEPELAKHNFWQIRLVYLLKPETMQFSAGEDGDEIAFMAPDLFKHSDSQYERSVYRYASLSQPLH